MYVCTLCMLYVYIYICIYKYVSKEVCMYVYLYVYVCMYCIYHIIFVYVCIYPFVNIFHKKNYIFTAIFTFPCMNLLGRMKSRLSTLSISIFTLKKNVLIYYIYEECLFTRKKLLCINKF